MLNRKPVIQKLWRGLLLVVFAISFIPKSFFHDVIASHTDSVSCEHPGKKTVCINPQGLKCSFYDLVVTTPYVGFSTAITLLKPFVPSGNNTTVYRFFYQHYYFGKEGRGPPATIGDPIV